MQVEYRTSFVMQLFGMLINDVMWVIFWVLYFDRFPVLNGWTLQDVVVLWAMMGSGFGLANTFFGNLARLNDLITQGQLDYYLALPKNVLYHVAIARISPTALGDLLFGPLLMLVMTEMTGARWAIYGVCSILAAAVIVGYTTIVGSFAFYMGSAERASSQAMYTLFHFVSYPSQIFPKGVKFLLFTVVPAGFVTTIPVDLVRSFAWGPMLGLVAGAAAFLGLGILVFYRGLRRYESGNMLIMRS